MSTTVSVYCKHKLDHNLHHLTNVCCRKTTQKPIKLPFTIYKSETESDIMKLNGKKGGMSKDSKVNGFKIKASNGPVGFEESINISPDFKVDDIKFKQFTTSFSLSGESHIKLNGGKSNTAIHRFRYTRVFFQDIADTKIKISQNTATVVGRFSYINKTSEDL